jgi:hypothetical protein
VDDRLDTVERALLGLGIGEVAAHERHVLRHRRTMALRQVVEHDHLVPGVLELADGVAADVARPARDQYLHRRPIPS